MSKIFKGIYLQGDTQAVLGSLKHTKATLLDPSDWDDLVNSQMARSPLNFAFDDDFVVAVGVFCDLTIGPNVESLKNIQMICLINCETKVADEMLSVYQYVFQFEDVGSCVDFLVAYYFGLTSSESDFYIHDIYMCLGHKEGLSCKIKSMEITSDFQLADNIGLLMASFDTKINFEKHIEVFNNIAGLDAPDFLPFFIGESCDEKVISKLLVI